MSNEKITRLIDIINSLPTKPLVIDALHLQDKLAVSGIILSLRTIQRDLKFLYDTALFGVLREERGAGYVWCVASEWRKTSLQAMSLTTAVSLLLSRRTLKQTLPEFSFSAFLPYFDTATQLLNKQCQLTYYPVQEGENEQQNIIFARLVSAYLKQTCISIKLCLEPHFNKDKVALFTNAGIKNIVFENNQPLFWVLRSPFDTRPCLYGLSQIKAVAMVRAGPHKQLYKTKIEVELNIICAYLHQLENYLNKHDIEFVIKGRSNAGVVFCLRCESHDEVWQTILCWFSKVSVIGPPWVKKHLRKRLSCLVQSIG